MADNRLLNAPNTFGTSFVAASARLGRYDSTEADVEGTIGLLGLQPGARVVEAGCGPGRFARALHAAGMKVTGYDISPQVIDLARQESPGPDYIVGDMGDLPRWSAEAIVNVFSSFGYGATPEDDAAILAAWRRALTPGGGLLMELSDLERAEHRLGRDGGVFKRSSGGVDEELRMDWDRQVLHVCYRTAEDELECDTRIYSRQQLTGMARSAGFVDIRTFGGFDRRPKTPDDRLVLVAATPAEEDEGQAAH